MKTEKAKEQHRRISVCGMLKYLDVSRSGYRAWQRREPSEQQKHREAMKMRIKEKYDASKGIYGAPKITQELRQEGEHISERTVGLYMRQWALEPFGSSTGLSQRRIQILATSFATTWESISIQTSQTPCGVQT